MSDVIMRLQLHRIFSRGQFFRYLIVGTWNTLFGYAMYATWVMLYDHLFHHRDLLLIVDLASITAIPINITVAYLCYKFFVFRTHGNYVREWLRCFAVYGIGMVPPLVVLPFLTRFLQRVPQFHQSAPYVAGALMTCFTVIYSYFGHKKFSFRAPNSTPSAPRPSM